MTDEQLKEFESMNIYDKIDVVCMMLDDAYARNPQFLIESALKNMVDYKDIVKDNEVLYVQ